MHSLARLSRASARASISHGRPLRMARGFRSSRRALAAQNFTMPAMSPTMTEGNISGWKVEEGDSFAAGDVLLEIETDKAQMDVEAQEDGKVMKIIIGDGSKSVKVGTRIGVLAEAGDDISALEIPPDEEAAPAETKLEDKSSEPAQAEAKNAPGKETESMDATKNNPATKDKSEATGKAAKQKGPLLPSVMQLMHEKSIPAEKADEIPATGPGGRLLKGDVLAYVGAISKSTPKKLQEIAEKLSHLDFNNVKLAPPSKAMPTEAKQELEGPKTVDIALSISLTEVLRVQKKMQETLGVTIPLSTFISRAIDVANDGLPRSKLHQPSPDELFDQILGLDTVDSHLSNGYFVPQLTALPTASLAGSYHKSDDVYDILTGTKPAAARPKPRLRTLPTAQNVFIVSASKGDEKRAEVFLERLKGYLETEPGRLVL